MVLYTLVVFGDNTFSLEAIYLSKAWRRVSLQGSVCSCSVNHCAANNSALRLSGSVKDFLILLPFIFLLASTRQFPEGSFCGLDIVYSSLSHKQKHNIS